MIYRLTIDCFHATGPVAEAMAGFQGDRLLAKSRVSLRDGGLLAAINHYSANASAQLVIVEESGDRQQILDRLGQLAEVCIAGTRVMVIGHLNDIGTYRALVGQGVSEYLIAPVTTADLVAAVETLFHDPSAAPRGRLIAFFAARGGAGASTLAHNTAWTLGRSVGEQVLLVDLDLAFGTLGLAFNTEARQTVGELLGTPERIDGQLLDRIVVKHDDHLLLMPSRADLRDPPVIEPESVDRLLDLVRQMASFVVVDLPHLWAPWIRHVLETADDLVIVARPDLPSLRDTKNLLEILGKRRGDKAPTRVVINKQDVYRKSQLSAKDFAETLKVEPTLALPFDPVFGELSNNGQMLGEAVKAHRLVDSFTQLASLVSGRQSLPARRKASANDAVTAWLKKAKLVK